VNRKQWRDQQANAIIWLRLEGKWRRWQGNQATSSFRRVIGKNVLPVTRKKREPGPNNGVLNGWPKEKAAGRRMKFHPVEAGGTSFALSALLR